MVKLRQLDDIASGFGTLCILVPVSLMMMLFFANYMIYPGEMQDLMESFEPSFVDPSGLVNTSALAENESKFTIFGFEIPILSDLLNMIINTISVVVGILNGFFTLITTCFAMDIAILNAVPGAFFIKAVIWCSLIVGVVELAWI